MSEPNAYGSELFVRGLPKTATNEDLLKCFSDIAPVKHAVVVVDTATGESKGFGFVRFAEFEDTETLLKKTNHVKLGNSNVSIELAKPRTRQGADKTKEYVEKEIVKKRKPRLIVRNLPWSVRDKSTFEKIFSKYGKVVDVLIPRAPGGRMKGFAFVVMAKNAAATKAVEESKDLVIEGRKVTVDFAVEKNDWLSDKDSKESDKEPKEDKVSEGDDENNENNSEDSFIGLDSDLEDNVDDDDDDDDDDVDEDEDEDEDEDGEEDILGDDEDEDEDNEPEPKRFKANPISYPSVFIRNVPYDATAETLKEHFEQFGEVKYALPVMDKQLNQPKGTAFVAFIKQDDCDACVSGAPQQRAPGSVLITDDVDPRYVFEGRVLSVSKAVDRERAEKLSQRNAEERDSARGKETKSDKRKLFLMNEGRILPNSKLASLISPSELEIRQKSFDQRKRQLAQNPSLHLSMTRLAIRNLPRSINEKALKQLGRKAVVSFAKEVVDKKRQPLTKEEVIRSVKHEDHVNDDKGNNKPKKTKHTGVVRQAKIIMEKKESGEFGRSRGYGFLEYRNHKAALMGLRWLNAYLVTKEDIFEGMSEAEARKLGPHPADANKRRLVVEFAIEHANIVSRRRETKLKVKAAAEMKAKAVEDDKKREAQEKARAMKDPKNIKRQIIGKKRRFKKQGGRN